MSQHCVVVGAGHAGGRAVEALRKYGYEGGITLIGEEPTLPFERPPLSKQYLKEPDAQRLPLIRPHEWYDENNVALRLGERVTAINTDARTVTVGLDDISYTELLLTTGGAVRHLQVPGAELAGIHTIRGQQDTDALAEALRTATQVVVVGGGFIGLEAAAVMAEGGASVTVLEAGPALMGRAVLPEIAKAVHARFEARGVVVRTSSAVTGFEGDDSISHVVLDGGEQVPCDLAVVGIGIIPESEIAGEAGVATENGIVVDAYCRTSVDNVYAAGDVTWHHNTRYDRSMRLESWQNAQNQAITAARNICGENIEYSDIPWFWSDQFDFKIQAAGAPDGVTDVVVRTLEDGDLLCFELAGDRVVGLQSLGAVKDMRRARKLLEKDKPADPIALADPAIAVKDLLK